MKKSLFLSFIVAILLWVSFGAILLGNWRPSWLPAAFLELTHPTSMGDFGQAFAALEGLVSSFALMLGLIAIVIQARQSADSNIIGAFSTRQQYLLADCERLEQQIQLLKNSGPHDPKLFGNMVDKKKRQLEEAKQIDEKLKKLLDKF